MSESVRRVSAESYVLHGSRLPSSISMNKQRGILTPRPDIWRVETMPPARRKDSSSIGKVRALGHYALVK